MKAIREFKVCRFLLLGVLVSSCAIRSPSSDQERFEQVVVPMYYATDRELIDTDSTTQLFSNGRGELSYGRFDAVVNTIKNQRTQVANPTEWTVTKDLPYTRDVALHNVRPLSFLQLTQQLSTHKGGSADPSALIYVHGYAKSFNEAAQNLARFIYEIDYHGAPIVFSWPSTGSAVGYVADKTTLEWSSHNLEAVLNQLTQNSQLKVLHVVAHSLGNQAMLESLTRVIQQQQAADKPWRFGEIILLAPDVDKGVFARDWAPTLKGIPSRVTLYLSAEDIPLRFSNSLSQYPRLGDSRFTPLAYPNIDTVDVSDAITLFRGHSYFRKEREVLTDLHHLINHRLAPETRPNLISTPTPEGLYWRLQTPTSLHE